MRNAAKMLRAAILAAVDHRANDPATMAAVDLLAESWISLEWLLAYLWNYPADDVFGLNSTTGIQYSPRLQAAVYTVTGKTWAEWRALAEQA